MVRPTNINQICTDIEVVNEWARKLSEGAYIQLLRTYINCKIANEIEKEEEEVAKLYKARKPGSSSSFYATKISDEVFVVTENYHSRQSPYTLYYPYVKEHKQVYKGYLNFELAAIAGFLYSLFGVTNVPHNFVNLIEDYLEAINASKTN